jgi:hypothetical protein
MYPPASIDENKKTKENSATRNKNKKIGLHSN